MPIAESVGVNVARVVRVKELVVVGRCPLTGPNTLLYEATMTDPKVFTKPWKIGVTLQRHKEAGARIIEDECLEDVNGVRHHVSPPGRK